VGAGLGGEYDPRNPSHKMLMSQLGAMSESERQHVQARVRAAMDAQVVNEGRHQGGRAPYGYVVVDAGPHPNSRKAVEGYRLLVLVLDEAAADVVRRIFAEYLDGLGDRAIANGLNRDGQLSRNRHRLGRHIRRCREQTGVRSQNLPMQVLQCGAGVRAQLLDQMFPQLPEVAQGLR
jgi:DNA invertase Pin-like site-specific DNA recombinase